MKKTDEKQSGNATDFVKHQSELDKAKNERIKSNATGAKSEAARKDRSHKTDVSQKKTGGGKQSSPGD